MFLRVTKQSIQGNLIRTTVQGMALMICFGLSLVGAKVARSADEAPAGQEETSKTPVLTSGQGRGDTPSKAPDQTSDSPAPQPTPPTSRRVERVQAGQAVDFPVDI